MKVVIIEDEKLTAKDLAKTLTALDPDIDIVATIHSVEEGLSFFEKEQNIDLIFSDIELGDGLSFDIFQKHPNSAPIVFCTAYQQYTLDAFTTAGIAYVLKPFSKPSIEQALTKFNNLKEKFDKPSLDLTKIYASLQDTLLGKVPSVIVHQGDKVIPISGHDIALFYLEDDCTFAYTFEQKRYIVNQKLDHLEKNFPGFYRANRQFLLNRKAIKDASQYFNRKMLVNLTIPFKEPIVIGKLKTTSFIQWLTHN